MNRVVFSVGVITLLVFAKTPSPVAADGIRSIGDIVAIRVYEQTSGIHQHLFVPNSAALERFEDLNLQFDFSPPTTSERYDVYYSNADGSPNFECGDWITIDGLFPTDQGGFNINGVRIEFSDGSFEFADRWSRVVAMGETGDATSIANAIDSDLSTWTTLGFSTDNKNRLSITVGFESSLGKLGDINCDGAINLLDVAPFVEILTAGGISIKADMNQDGAVDLLDVQPFVNLITG